LAIHTYIYIYIYIYHTLGNDSKPRKMSITRESKPKRSALVVKCREESDREIDPEKEHQRSKKMKKKTSAAKAGRCCCMPAGACLQMARKK
jgi:hypothetical protein